MPPRQQVGAMTADRERGQVGSTRDGDAFRDVLQQRVQQALLLFRRDQQPLSFLLGPLARGDVPDDSHRADRLPAVVVQEGDGADGMHRLPVLAAVAHLDFPEPMREELGRRLLQHRGRRIGAEQFIRMPPDRLRRRPPVDAFRTLVPASDQEAFVSREDRVRNAVHQARLIANRFLGLFARGDVLEHRDDGDNAAAASLVPVRN